MSQAKHVQAAKKYHATFPAATAATGFVNQQGPFTDKRQAAVAQRKLADNVAQSPRMMAQRAQMAMIRGEIVQQQNPEAVSNLPVQAKAESAPNRTGMPDPLKTGIENLSGLGMDNVRVHFNSDKPARLNAHAYAQGTAIHVAPGQEKHLPHEAWHVVQQMQARVKPTMQMKGGVPVNDEKGLEAEADVMGAKALQMSSYGTSGFSSYTYKSASGVAPIAQYAPVQLTEIGKRWGGLIVGTLGGIAGGVGGYLYSTASAVAGGVTGGVKGALTGYENGGLRGAAVGTLLGGAAGAAAGLYSSTGAGALIGAKLGSSAGALIGDAIGDHVSGPDPARAARTDIAAEMSARLHLLQVDLIHHDTRKAGLIHKVGPSEGMRRASAAMSAREVALLEWMFDSLGPQNFAEVARGGQVRVDYDPHVFNALVALGAQRRPSSHYAGLVFASGFSQVPNRQYGTKGEYLPTVLFGKIMSRDGQPFMYFQPEGNAFNPDTGFRESALHIKDAIAYFAAGIQQGPHGQSVRTDEDPISNRAKYDTTISDKYGLARVGDFSAFIQNLLLSNVNRDKLALAIGATAIVGTGLAAYVPLALTFMTSVGLAGAAGAVWGLYWSSLKAKHA